MLVGCHRESGQRFFTPLPARTTRGSPPPEAYAEVMPIMVAKAKASHMVSTDSAQSFQKVMGEDLPGNPHGKVNLKHPIVCRSTIPKCCLIVFSVAGHVFLLCMRCASLGAQVSTETGEIINQLFPHGAS